MKESVRSFRVEVISEGKYSCRSVFTRIRRVRSEAKITAAVGQCRMGTAKLGSRLNLLLAEQ